MTSPEVPTGGNARRKQILAGPKGTEVALGRFVGSVLDGWVRSA